MIGVDTVEDGPSKAEGGAYSVGVGKGRQRLLEEVLKLDSSSDANKGNAPSGSNLSMNQTLEGHQGNIMVVLGQKAGCKPIKG